MSIPRLLLLSWCMALYAGEAPAIPLPAPQSLVLYHDGLRLVSHLAVGAGRTRIALPTAVGDLVEVGSADAWSLDSRIESAEPPPLPAQLTADMVEWAALVHRERIHDAGAEATERMAAELGQRLAQRAIAPARGETDSWQAALDAIISLRQGTLREGQALAQGWRELHSKAAQELATGLTAAAVMGLDDGTHPTDLSDPAFAAQRAWRAAAASSAPVRILVVERSGPGVVEVVTERTDVHWSPRARLVAGKGAALLVRQAVVQVPAGLTLAALPARLIGSAREQALHGATLVARTVTANSAPVVERRSVTTSTRSVEWAELGGGASRAQTWELPALAIAAPAERGAEVVAELQQGALAVVADEWVLAPDLAPILVRRLSVRLDAQTLSAGTLELVIDGTVLGRRVQPEVPAGGLIHLAAGEDQRVFLAATTPWEEDPARPINRKRAGGDYRLRNLSGDVLRFSCYLSMPVSAAKGVTVSVDEVATPGWKEVQPGILRWDLELQPGAETILRRGWKIEAEGKLRL